MKVLILITGLAAAVCGAETNAVLPALHVLAVGKAMPNDSSQMQVRGRSAVAGISAAIRKSCPAAKIDGLVEHPMTLEQVRSGRVREQVTGSMIEQKLRTLAVTVNPEDTVIIYTHTHGRKHSTPESSSLGGLVVELPKNRPGRRGMMLWNEYADLLLKVPAKNVIVLTMSCYSGGLIEYLNSPDVKAQWENRREEGRNFVVLTSQNAEEMSPPIMINGEVINPFTYAVMKLFAEEAGEGMTLGAMIDFVLHTTEHAVCDIPQRGNIAKPQVTGSYCRDDVPGFHDRAR